MTRITDKDLQSVVDRINKMTGSPMAPYVKGEDGKHRAQIGNYHLDYAYGGVRLVRMHNEAGGISDVLRGSYVTKRELYNLMYAFIYGLEQAEEVKDA